MWHPKTTVATKWQKPKETQWTWCVHLGDVEGMLTLSFACWLSVLVQFGSKAGTRQGRPCIKSETVTEIFIQDSYRSRSINKVLNEIKLKQNKTPTVYFKRYCSEGDLRYVRYSGMKTILDHMKLFTCNFQAIVLTIFVDIKIAGFKQHRDNQSKVLVHCVWTYLEKAVHSKAKSSKMISWPSRCQLHMCHGKKSRFVGDGHPTFNRNPYNGYINPY